MGSVYEARHRSIDRRFAIKFLLPEYSRNKEMLRRFENEAKAAGRLEHNNIAAVTDYGRAPDGSLYIVMEFLPGRDCAAELCKVGKFSIARATNIVYQASMGLTVAHQAGIVHRDIKPENLLLAKGLDGEDLVKILDFGIAKLRCPEASAMTASGVTMGTMFYMSPEQIRDSGKVDQRADVWSLGVMLYELLANVRPFDGANVTEVIFRIVHAEPPRIETLRPDLPKALAVAIHRALEKDPEKRTASAAAFADAIRPFTNRGSIPSPGRDIATDETVASVPPSVRRKATTSQLGVAEIPAKTPRFRKAILWPALLGIAGIGFTASLIRERNSPVERPGVTTATAQGSLATALPAGTPALLALPANSVPIEQVRTMSAPTSNSLADAPELRKVEARPSLGARKKEAPPSPAVPSVQGEVKPPRRATNSSGVPITIDPHNPF